MKFSIGNAKLGDNCLVASRPVGDTCPSSCEFLGHGCYAENTEKRYPNVRQSVMANLITESGRIRSMFLLAKSQGKSVRLHAYGDLYKNGKLDTVYLNNLVTAFNSLKIEDRPAVWLYTHVISKKVLILQDIGIQLYASVNSAKQLKKAKKLGFKLFAWSDSSQQISKRKQHGKPHSHLPNYLTIEGERFIVCPEQRKGRTKVTCTGSCSVDKQSGKMVKTVACNACVKGISNVLFLLH